MTCSQCAFTERVKSDPDLIRCTNPKCKEYFGCTCEPTSKACEKIERKK